MRWEKIHPDPPQHLQLGFGGVCSGPGKRWGHTCNAIKGGRFLYVFGGYGKDNCQTNQVHVYDTVNRTWSQPVIKGTPPIPRDSHSCTNVDDNLFVFGGTDGMNPLNGLHVLDTSTSTWISPNVRGEAPKAREGHSAALVGKRIFIFGGCGKSSVTDNEVYFSDLYILNTETFVWRRAVTMGTPPSARDSHTCSSWKNKIIVVGGEDAHDYYLSDVHILDTETLVWKELNTSGHILPPRAGHSTVAFGKNLFVFGGFTDAQNLYDDLHMLDVETGVWTKFAAIGEGPSARFSVAGECLDPLKGVLVFIGGCNKSLEALDDMHYLHTGFMSTCARDDQSVGRLSLRKQLKLKCQEQNLANYMNDKALVNIEVDGYIHQSSPLASYPPPRDNFPCNQTQFLYGKRTFQAKLTESIPYGYTIETTIDGRPLRGVLFATKGNSFPISDQSLSRKRGSPGAGILFNGDHDGKSKTPKCTAQDAIDRQGADIDNKKKDSVSVETEGAKILSEGANTKASALHETEAAANPMEGANPKDSVLLEAEAAITPDNVVDEKESNPCVTEATADPDMESQLKQNAYQLDKDPADPGPSTASLNLNDDQSNEALAKTSEDETTKNDAVSTQNQEGTPGNDDREDPALQM